MWIKYQDKLVNLSQCSSIELREIEAFEGPTYWIIEAYVAGCQEQGSRIYQGTKQECIENLEYLSGATEIAAWQLA